MKDIHKALNTSTISGECHLEAVALTTILVPSHFCQVTSIPIKIGMMKYTGMIGYQFSSPWNGH